MCFLIDILCTKILCSADLCFHLTWLYGEFASVLIDKY